MARKSITPAFRQLTGTHLADQHHRVGITDYPLFLPLHLQPGRITHDQIKTAARQQISKFQIPMQRPDAFGYCFYLTQSLKLSLELFHIHKAVAVAEIHRQLFGLGVGK